MQISLIFLNKIIRYRKGFSLQKKILFLLPFILASLCIQAQNPTSIIKKKFSFTIPARGQKTYKIIVPDGAKKISAVISGQTEMVNLKIIGPTDVVLCKNTTWSYLSTWKKPLHCSVSIVNNKRQSPGTWTVEVEGAVREGDLNKIKKISGVLTVFIDLYQPVKKLERPPAVLPFERKFHFSVSARGQKNFRITVPKGAKSIKAVVSGQTEMINLDIVGPTSVTLCHSSTWSYLSTWKKPLHCSVGIINNKQQSPGTWTVKVEGAVHVSKMNNIKSVSGVLTIYVR